MKLEQFGGKLEAKFDEWLAKFEANPVSVSIKVVIVLLLLRWAWRSFK